eukprot:5915888-Karenia_brevis.AAC.1
MMMWYSPPAVQELAVLGNDRNITSKCHTCGIADALWDALYIRWRSETRSCPGICTHSNTLGTQHRKVRLMRVALSAPGGTPWRYLFCRSPAIKRKDPSSSFTFHL